MSEATHQLKKQILFDLWVGLVNVFDAKVGNGSQNHEFRGLRPKRRRSEKRVVGGMPWARSDRLPRSAIRATSSFFACE